MSRTEISCICGEKGRGQFQKDLGSKVQDGLAGRESKPEGRRERGRDRAIETQRQ